MKPRKPYTINLEAVDRLNKQGKTITEIASLLGHSIGGLARRFRRFRKRGLLFLNLMRGLKERLRRHANLYPK